MQISTGNQYSVLFLVPFRILGIQRSKLPYGLHIFSHNLFSPIASRVLSFAYSSAEEAATDFYVKFC